IIRHDLGTSRYHFSSRAYLDSAQTVLGNVASELDFPVNAVFAGGSLTLLGARPGGLPRSLTAEGLVNVDDPGTVMLDHDWFDYRDRCDGNFSYPESGAALKGHDVTLSGSWGMWRRGRVSVDALGGFRTYRVDEALPGTRGWQLDSSFHRHDFTIPDTL